MDKKSFLKAAVRYILHGEKLNSNPPLWPALKQQLLSGGCFSADELEEQRNYIIDVYGDEIKESLRGQPSNASAPSKSSTTEETASKGISQQGDSGFDGSSKDNAPSPDSFSEDEITAPAVDKTKDHQRLLSVFVNGWKGAGLKYGTGENSYVRIEWAKAYGLNTERECRLRWKFDDCSLTQETLFIPRLDLESLGCDVLFGTKHLDPSFNKSIDNSDDEGTGAPDPGRDQQGQFMVSVAEISSSQLTHAWVDQTSRNAMPPETMPHLEPNMKFLSQLIVNLDYEYQLRGSGGHAGGTINTLSSAALGVETNCNKRRNPTQDLDTIIHSNKRPRQTGLEIPNE